MKLRIVRFIRTPDYNNLFSGDPTWVTESIGGMGEDHHHACCRPCTTWGRLRNRT